MRTGERECVCGVVALSETNTKEEAKELLDLWTSAVESFDKSMCFYWLR